MRIAILQPGYLPWLGFFDQLRRSDCFVIYDDVQYTRRDWRSRNRIKTRTGPQWLTVPIVNRGRFLQLINEAEIDYGQDWVHKHLGAVRSNYARAPFFEEYFPELTSILEARPQRLVELDLDIIRFCAKWLEIETPILLASQLMVDGTSSDRLLNICNRLGALYYLTGDAARGYLDESLFAEAGITVEYHNYRHPQYKQLHGPFVPYLSIIDLLFNHGPDSLRILSGEIIVQ